MPSAAERKVKPSIAETDPPALNLRLNTARTRSRKRPKRRLSSPDTSAKDLRKGCTASELPLQNLREAARRTAPIRILHIFQIAMLKNVLRENAIQKKSGRPPTTAGIALLPRLRERKYVNPPPRRRATRAEGLSRRLPGQSAIRRGRQAKSRLCRRSA